MTQDHYNLTSALWALVLDSFGLSGLLRFDSRLDYLEIYELRLVVENLPRNIRKTIDAVACQGGSVVVLLHNTIILQSTYFWVAGWYPTNPRMIIDVAVKSLCLRVGQIFETVHDSSPQTPEIKNLFCISPYERGHEADRKEERTKEPHAHNVVVRGLESIDPQKAEKPRRGEVQNSRSSCRSMGYMRDVSYNLGYRLNEVCDHAFMTDRMSKILKLN